MGSVSDIKIDDWVDRAIDQLDDEKKFGIALAEYSRTIIDRPENITKISNSFAGLAVHLQNAVILRELRLWCCRVWERNGHSLPAIADRFMTHSEAIANARRAAHPDWPERQLKAETLPGEIQDFHSKVNTIVESQLLVELRITRDEHFAHLLSGVSGTRRKNPIKDGREGYTYNEVLDLCDVSVELIKKSIWIWQFRSHDTLKTRKAIRRHYERYWALLPVFSELEDQLRQAIIDEDGV